MAHFNEGYKNIQVKLIYADKDLAKHAYEFGREGESIHYDLPEQYSPKHTDCLLFVDNLINGKTFPKFCLEGHRISFEVKGISRICLSQLTRDNAIFCSGTQGTKVLDQTYNIPLNIYNDKDIMKELTEAQEHLERAYQMCCEKDLPYPESRYILIGSHTINCNCSFTPAAFVRACYSRTNNSFCDELNYVYRKMFYELKKFINSLDGQLDKAIWEWLINENNCINDKYYTRASIFNSDFSPLEQQKHQLPRIPAQNDWRNSCWKLELERMLVEEPWLLTEKEVNEIRHWLSIEKDKLPTTFIKGNYWSPAEMVKRADFYKENKNA